MFLWSEMCYFGTIIDRKSVAHALAGLRVYARLTLRTCLLGLRSLNLAGPYGLLCYAYMKYLAVLRVQATRLAYALSAKFPENILIQI